MLLFLRRKSNQKERFFFSGEKEAKRANWLINVQKQNAVLRLKFFFGSFFFQEKGTKRSFQNEIVLCCDGDDTACVPSPCINLKEWKSFVANCSFCFFFS